MSTPEIAVTVRPLLGNESASYRALRLECLRQHPAFFGTTHAEEAAVSVLPFERFIQLGDPANFMLGAFLGGDLRGICGLRRETRLTTRHRGELVQLYVAPSAVGRGIGGMLVEAVLRRGFSDPRLKQIVLGVSAENRAAIALYERAGFREYGRLEGYFVDDTRSTTQLFMVTERRPEESDAA